MTEKEWDQLFDLIEKAINLDGLIADDKSEKIREEAAARSQDGNLNEFAALCEE
jgi:hypothetical protein